MPPPQKPPTPPGSFWRRRAFASLICLLTSAALYLRYFIEDSASSPPILPEDITFSCSPYDPPRRVAIIGAGSGGSSAAYHLSHYTNACPNIHITIYERNAYVGGRSTTVNVRDDPSEPVELGASIFVSVNHNLVKAAEKFGLVSQSGFGSSGVNEADEERDTIGVYDGEKWRYITPYDPTGGWWTTIKLLWKYGTAPVRTRNRMKETVGKFLKMYDAPVFPFEDLTQAVRDVELADTVAVTGETFLATSGVGMDFGEDIIQASTRVNYAQNLDTIHGVETMVCMATDGAMSIEGGNWQIFASMLDHSGALVLLNTSVNTMTRKDDGKFAITATALGDKTLAHDYDTVILAAPFQFANITLTPPPVTPIPVIPYINLHVTLFTSPHRLDPSYFKLPLGTSVPRTVLTTTSPHGKAPDYYSISTLRKLRNPDTGSWEWLYKVFSPAPLSPDSLQEILWSDDPDVVTWKHEKIWHSYPVEHPRVTFEGIRYPLKGGGDVWYTSGIEGFISTMETSSLMGMNVAKLVSREWARDLQDRQENAEEL